MSDPLPQPRQSAPWEKFGPEHRAFLAGFALGWLLCMVVGVAVMAVLVAL